MSAVFCKVEQDCFGEMTIKNGGLFFKIAVSDVLIGVALHFYYEIP